MNLLIFILTKSRHFQETFSLLIKIIRMKILNTFRNPVFWKDIESDNKSYLKSIQSKH